MGVVEMMLRKQIRAGQMVDVTLIGGRELRGELIAFFEDGFLLLEQGFERPVAFAGIATCAPTLCVQPEYKEKQREVPAPAEEKTTSEEPEVVTQEEGWIERYDAAAGVGSIDCAQKHAIFDIADVLDQQLVDQLAGWYGRPIAVQCTLRIKGALCKATGITGRRAQERYTKPDKNAAQPTEHHGFGEILYFDKKGGYGRAREGDVRFLFRREDIASDALWKEILQSSNTCGIKVAFTAVSDGKRVKYTRLRELAALETPESVKKPEFSAEPGQDVNPQARTEFSDGTTMEQDEHAGYIMFYNTEKSFGRLQQENGERYYFRANDVMQKSLLEHLNGRMNVADTAVTFSIKHLTTGKTAAGRVKWGAPRAPKADEPEIKESKTPEPMKPEAKKAEELPMNRYCENLAALWMVNRETLAERMRAAAEKAEDMELRRDLMLESVALSDAMREGRDDAALRYLRLFAREDGEEQLGAFLAGASYAGEEMFDALTQLYAVSDGACSRLCGIIAEDGELVTLRGEILARFGQVPETAQNLKELWRPLVEAERARTTYGSLLPTKEALCAVEDISQKERWEKLLDALKDAEQGAQQDLAQVAQLAAEERERIAKRPLRMAVEWMLPLLDRLENALRGEGRAQAVRAQALGAVTAGGVRFGVMELAGEARGVRVQVGERALEVGALQGVRRVALPVAEECPQVQVKWEGGQDEREMQFAPMDAPRMNEAQALAHIREDGLVVLRGGAEELDALAESLRAESGCAVVRVPGGEDETGDARRILDALESEIREKYGDSVADLMEMPAKDAREKMEPAELEPALLGALRSFGDMRLLHDVLKGARIALVIDAGARAENLVRLVRATAENGVCAAIAVRADAQEIEGAPTIEVCADRLEDRLRAAGLGTQDLLVAEG